MYYHRPIGTPTEEFFLLGPEDSLGFRLVTAGYDLWLINPRGSELSRRHVTLNPYSVEFWNFDLVSMANDHLVAVDFILQQTGYEQLHMYAYGTGGMAFAYAISLYPDFFNPRVRGVQYVASVLSCVHTRTGPYQMVASIPGILNTLSSLGLITIADTNPISDLILGSFCNPFPWLCMLGQQLTAGEVNPIVDDPDAYANFLFRGTYGFGTHITQHFTQSYRTGEISYYDYGTEGNLVEYGSETAPLVDYANHQMPIALY